ncbi:MAG: TonB-dependent receptor [Acidobacteria bacterium]|nr:TonB-dependent receptor [Acidobacteriota bacterium]
MHWSARRTLVTPLFFALPLLAALLTAALSAQVMDGRLEVKVTDPSGRPVPASVRLEGRSPDFSATAEADDEGRAALRRLPPGVYQLLVRQPGFEDAVEPVEIRSAVPQTIEIQLQLGAVRDAVTVEAEPPLLDPLQPSRPMRAGSRQLSETLGTTLGRSTIDVVTTMPGWLLEANAVLHPRGSEYDTQYVVDGMPVYDNRSIAFAPAFENSEFEAVNILTAGIPAEYGRRLGGVIALDTRRANYRGHRSAVDLQGGSYDTYLGSASHQYAAERTVVSLGLQGGQTDRYLDPPSLENFTNHGSSSGFNARLEQDLTDRDRLTFYLRSNHAGFLVPNDLVQQAAGQRQDRTSAETAGQIHYQHTFSSRALGSVRGMVRDLTSRLWSNTLSTPVYVNQDRGFREGAVIGDLTVQGEHHTFKAGGDLRLNNIRERFLLAEPDELPETDLEFGDKRRSTEVGLFVQDQIRLGRFAANLGVRFDHYALLIEDNAISPRVALSYYVREADLQLYASYDRIFQPPPIENLLLSSGAAGLGLDNVDDAVAVPASRANFFEVGLRKPLGRAVRLDASHYWRTFRNYIDDDVFFNTGISFPITFDTARIEGTEVRLEMPRWKRVSSFVSYSNMMGRATSPVTGGLFIQGGEAEELRDVVQHFPITQDQRNTVAAQVRVEPHRRMWLSAGVRYGSGLPVELEDDADDDDGDGDDDEDDSPEALADDEDDDNPVQPIPQAILDRVNFERGRVRPNFSLDFSVGARVWEREQRSATLQVDLRNATDRLNVINFSGLFSGTALAPGRQVSVQLKLRF